MTATAKTMARYKVIADSGGWQVRFFCDLSGEQRYRALIPQARDEEEAARLAWDSGGKEQFNLCPKCGTALRRPKGAQLFQK